MAKNNKSNSIAGKNILLGVTGSIAAYKAPELVRLFIYGGANVKCILTANGSRFVTSLTLETVSKNKVFTDMFEEFEHSIEHIALSDWADIALIAPASADTIAKIASGRAEDLLSSTVLSMNKPMLVAPAMNERMWANPATAYNVEKLRSYGYSIVGPGCGELACGTSGMGRLANLEEIIQAVKNNLTIFKSGVRASTL